jgi:hypothetical protein
MTTETLIAAYGPATEALAKELRSLLLEQLPGITEQPDEKAGIVGYNYGTGYKTMIGSIILSKKGVKLGLYKGSELPDPHGLLAGSGKVHKYVAMKTAEDIHRPGVKSLLEAAIAAYRQRCES